MKKYSKIFIIVIISSLLVTSSCKKEEEIIEGCKDSAAMNFNATATSNDGSCIFAYDIAQGTWFFESQCADIPSGFEFINDILPESVDIDGEGDGVLSLTILDTITIYGSINDAGYIVIAQQELFSFDTTVGGFIPITVSFEVSGSGIIASQDSGNMDLDYSATPSLPLPGFENLDFSCNVVLSREDEEPGE